MLTKRYLTKNEEELGVIDNYTDATQTVQLSDGRYGFCDGLGGVFARVVVGIPGYDYEYGEAEAGPEHTNAHDALKGQGTFPQGSELYFRDRLK